MIEGHSRDFAKIATRYARDVVRGRILACRQTRLACKRHLDDLRRSRSRKGPRWRYVFSEWHAADICDFAEKFPHVEGEWSSETLVLEPWQIFILACVFGWRDRETGYRRFNTAYIEVARKQGKSFLTAVVTLYCLACDGEVGPQIKTAATTGSQARIIFDVAKKMAERSPEFREAFGIEVYANAIACLSTGGTIQPINSKASTQDGLNPHLTTIDELHAHKDRSLFDVLKSARGARKNPLSWYITTAGYNVDGVCYEQRDYVCKILEGIFPGDHYFGIVYTLDDGDDEFEEGLWGKANPNLGVSVQLEEMRTYAEEARNSPQSLAEFRTKRLNIWTSAASGWLNMPAWNKCSAELPDLTRQVCFGGLDLATTGDISALELWFPFVEPPTVLSYFWIPEDDIVERTRRDGVPYVAWRDAGLLEATPGDVTDFAWIRRRINELATRYQIQAIGYDRRFSYDLAPRLEEDGFRMVDVPQRLDTIGPWAEHLERLIKTGGFSHGGHPVLRWMGSNCVVRVGVEGLKMPSKARSPDKIDGIVAFLMALAVAEPEEISAPPVQYRAVERSRRSSSSLFSDF